MKRCKLIGWKEKIALPALGIKSIKVKVDTGAKTSALHAENIEEFKKGAVTYVRFRICTTKLSKKPKLKVEARLVEYRMVRSSSGHESLRPVIRTEIQIGKEKWKIEVTLVNRDIMGVRMLLGRAAIQNRFWVDPTQAYITTPLKKKKR